jgi:hypothetical protein
LFGLCGNGGLWVGCCTRAFGQDLPVELTFQFLLVGRQVIELNGRYSATKLLTALAQPGHNPPVEVVIQFE